MEALIYTTLNFGTLIIRKKQIKKAAKVNGKRR